jgi:hypothetical protein
VISAVGLLWRLRKAGPHTPVSEESAAEKRALYVVAITFILLAIYITSEAAKALISQEEPLTSPAGIILAVLSVAVLPTLAFPKQRIGNEMGSRALVRLQRDMGLLLPVTDPVTRCWRVRGSRLVVG